MKHNTVGYNEAKHWGTFSRPVEQRQWQAAQDTAGGLNKVRSCSQFKEHLISALLSFRAWKLIKEMLEPERLVCRAVPQAKQSPLFTSGLLYKPFLLSVIWFNKFWKILKDREGGWLNIACCRILFHHILNCWNWTLCPHVTQTLPSLLLPPLNPYKWDIIFSLRSH